MKKKPNLFIVGALKCGTTSLWHWLLNHPKIYMARLKEPDYFYRNGKISSLKEYEELFNGASEGHKLVGEASGRYLYSRTAIPNLLSYVDETPKFIVMLRNPIEMAVSLHAQRVNSLNENETKFEDAWRLQNEDGRPREGLPTFLYYQRATAVKFSTNEELNSIQAEIEDGLVRCLVRG